LTEKRKKKEKDLRETFEKVSLMILSKLLNAPRDSARSAAGQLAFYSGLSSLLMINIIIQNNCISPNNSDASNCR